MQWVTAIFLPLDGPEQYVIVVRDPDNDPLRLTRKQRHEKLGRRSATLGWKDLNKTPPEFWRDAIVKLLGDGEPRTFNRIMLELTDYAYEADVGFQRNPHHGLNLALRERKVMATTEAPVYLTLTDERAVVPRWPRAL